MLAGKTYYRSLITGYVYEVDDKTDAVERCLVNGYRKQCFHQSGEDLKASHAAKKSLVELDAYNAEAALRHLEHYGQDRAQQ